MSVLICFSLFQYIKLPVTTTKTQIKINKNNTDIFKSNKTIFFSTLGSTKWKWEISPLQLHFKSLLFLNILF